jgi:magnesium transporter
MCGEGDRRALAETDLPSASRPPLETALAHVTPNVPVASPSARAGDLRRSLAGRRFDTVAAVAVCQGGRLVGLLDPASLWAASDGTPVAELMDAAPPVVGPGVDQEVAAWRAVQRRQSTLAVVDRDGHFLGLVPPERLLAVLLAEHEEDLARLGGFTHDLAAARAAAEEPVRRRLRHRLPWLLVGLAGAFAAASLVGAFEEQLRDRFLLAFFVPGVVYLADAVGTQTEALVIRGLSVGVPVGRVVRREALTGLLVGAALALVFYPVALAGWGRPDVALAVGLALLAACSIATLVALLLPLLFHRLGADPAFGSGPLATVVQDLLSILLLFAIGVALVRPDA